MNDDMRFGMFVVLTIFLALVIAGLYRLTEYGMVEANVEKDVKVHYQKILENYTCVPRLPDAPTQGCVMNGYWIPMCWNVSINKTEEI